MDPLDYIRAFRRRWPIVAIAVVAAATVGALTVEVVPARPQVQQYKATASLMSVSRETGLGRIAAFVKVGEVPRRAAQKLQYEGKPSALASGITAESDANAGTLRISATSRDPKRAELEANAFAEELIGFLTDRAAQTHARGVDTASKQADQLKAEIADLEARIAGASESDARPLRAERDAKLRRYGTLIDTLQGLITKGPSATELEFVERASALPITASGFQAPNTRNSRLLFAAAIGLVGGVALVLVLERFDTKIRTRRSAEKYFGLPVLAEVPKFRRFIRRKMSLATHFDPASPHAEAFRLLEAGITLARSPIDPSSGNGRKAKRADPPETILVTSPGPGDGKSTVVSNLAAVMAQLGKQVLIVSCDFYRPAISRVLGLQSRKGLSNALTPKAGQRKQSGMSSPRQRLLEQVIVKSKLERVWVIPSGPSPRNPAELLASDDMQQLLSEAREAFDVTLLDTAPILSASDATHLFSQTEAVVVVARAGKTSFEQAQRTSELIERFGAPAIGTVLNRADTILQVRRNYRAPAYLPKRRKRKGIPQLARHSQRS